MKTGALVTDEMVLGIIADRIKEDDCKARHEQHAPPMIASPPPRRVDDVRERWPRSVAYSAIPTLPLFSRWRGGEGTCSCARRLMGARHAGRRALFLSSQRCANLCVNPSVTRLKHFLNRVVVYLAYAVGLRPRRLPAHAGGCTPFIPLPS